MGAGAEERDSSGRMGNERRGDGHMEGVAIISIIRKYLPWSAMYNTNRNMGMTDMPKSRKRGR